MTMILWDFYEPGEFSNHSSSGIPQNNFNGPHPPYPLEIPANEEEDFMKEENDLEFFANHDEIDSEPLDQDGTQDFQVPELQNNNLINDQVEDQVVPLVELKNGNNICNLNIISVEEMEEMEADPELHHVSTTFYSTHPAHIFPLPHQGIIHFLEQEDSESR